MASLLPNETESAAAFQGDEVNTPTATKKSPEAAESISIYQYIDHATTLQQGASTVNVPLHRATHHDIRVQVLPIKLAAILNEPRFSHVIAWLPHGRAWKVLRPREFTDLVAPHYFEYPNYNSFIRLVNAWGFRRMTTGVDANAYFHEVRSLRS